MDKAELIDRARRQMRYNLSAPSWSVRQTLALTARILYSKGHDSGLAGQITARGERAGTFYTQRLGFGFDEITASNLLLVSEDLDVLEGDGMANPANRFHSWIYRGREDVSCIIHTHPTYVAALSMLERPLKVSHMDACVLYEDVGFLREWPGIPVGNEEGQLISSALGTKRAVLLAHHGLVVAARSIQEACVLAVQCERAASLQLLAESAGEIRDIDSRHGREAHDWILQEARSQATFYYYARQILGATPLDDDHPLR
jgi:L-fuculose-phosphate aldolase